MLSAHYDEAQQRWRVETDTGGVFWARFLIAATGCLSAQNIPTFDGMESFQGESYHTGSWPIESVDLTGKNVAVIGAGSSGVQSIPRIAEMAKHLYVFQRTAQYSVPAGEAAIDPERQRRRQEAVSEWRHDALRSFGGLPEMVVPQRSVM